MNSTFSKAEIKLNLIEKWKYFFSYHFLNNKENLNLIVEVIRENLKDKPLVYLNLEKYKKKHEKNKRIKYDFDYVGHIVNAFSNYNIQLQMQVIARIYTFLETTPPRDFKDMIQYIKNTFEKRKIPSGDMVGIVAAQSISERFTQTTLNSFHVAGTKKGAAQTGIKRIVELFDALKTLQLPLVEGVETSYDINRIVYKTLGSIALNNGIRHNYKNNEGQLYKNRINSYELFFRLKDKKDLEFIKMSKNMTNINWHWRWDKDQAKINNKYQGEIVILLPDKLTLPNIKSRFRKLQDLHIFGAVGAEEADEDTIFFKPGTENFKTLTIEDILDAFPDVNFKKLIPNDIHFIYKTFGIEATRTYLVREIPKVLSKEGIELDIRHILLLVDNMTCEGFIKANKYSGIKMKESVFLKATFEQATKTFARAAASSTSDNLQNVSAQLVVGKTPNVGTNVVKCLPVYTEVKDVVEHVQEKQVTETFSPGYAPMEYDNEYEQKYNNTYDDGDVEYFPSSPQPQQQPVEIIEPTFL